MERIYEVWPVKSTVCQQSTSIYCRNFVGCGQHQWDRSSYSTVGKRRAAEQAGAVVFLGWIPCQVYPRFAWLLTMIMILESGPDLE